MSNRNLTNVDKQSSHSSDKLLQILECISSNRTPVRLQDLAEQVGMSQSTVLRYLYALQNADYVYQEEGTSRYALTWKICGLTNNLNSLLSLRSIASPFIHETSDALQLGVCLVVNQVHQCVYIDCVDNPLANGTSLHYIGKRAPLHATASGKILLTSYSESQLDEYIATLGLPKLTEYTITDRTALVKELEKVRKQGYATDHQECEKGFNCFSMPLHSFSRSIVATISVFGSVEDITEKSEKEKIYPYLSKTAANISKRLGYVSNGGNKKRPFEAVLT